MDKTQTALFCHLGNKVEMMRCQSIFSVPLIYVHITSFFPSRVACAAASRATGTLNGEQLT